MVKRALINNKVDHLVDFIDIESDRGWELRTSFNIMLLPVFIIGIEVEHSPQKAIQMIKEWDNAQNADT
jgi:hypothetical protein